MRGPQSLEPPLSLPTFPVSPLIPQRRRFAANSHLQRLPPRKYGVSAVTQGITYKSAQPLVVAGAVTLTTNLQLPKSDTTLVLVQEQNGPVSEGSGGEHLSRKEVSILPLNSRRSTAVPGHSAAVPGTYRGDSQRAAADGGRVRQPQGSPLNHGSLCPGRSAGTHQTNVA